MIIVSAFGIDPEKCLLHPVPKRQRTQSKTSGKYGPGNDITISHSTTAYQQKNPRRKHWSCGGDSSIKRGLLAVNLGIAVNRLVTELFLDPEQLVILGHTVGTRHRAGLDLTRIGRYGDVGDRRILGSPERCEVTDVYPARCAISIASSVSVSVPI